MGAGILVVDDAKLERFFLCKLLERIGIQADEAADGETALAMARDTDYKLLLIDERMPGPDGWDGSAGKSPPSRSSCLVKKTKMQGIRCSS